MKIQLIQTSHGPVEYSGSGSGAPVLFLHGGHSNCRETLFHKGLDLEKFRLITPSRPGYGKTPLSDKTSPEAAAGLMVALLDQLELDRVTVYGISAGGPTAIALAGLYPDRVSRLILASAVTRKWLDKKDKIYRTARLIFHPAVEGFIWGMVRLFSRLTPRLIAGSFYPQFSTRPPHELRSADVKELTGTLSSYRSGTGFLNDIDQQVDESLLREIHCPTLIIHSKNDGSVPPDHGEHAHQSIQGSRLFTPDNEWGHLVWIGTDAPEVLRVVNEFLEEKE